MLVKVYNLFRNLFPKRKSHSEQALADLYKNAPKGNMSSAESYRTFDAANPYLRGQAMPGVRDYVSPVCGDRLLATLNNDDGLESDQEYYYITHDNGRDFRVWKFKRPKKQTEEEIVKAYYEHPYGFRSWLEERCIESQEHDWVKQNEEK